MNVSAASVQERFAAAEARAKGKAQSNYDKAVKVLAEVAAAKRYKVLVAA